MKVYVPILLNLILGFILIPSSSAENLKGKIGIGLNCPGVGLRYGVSSRICLEARGQYGDDILVYGARGYYYLNPHSQVSYFCGMETDLISFEGEVSEGDGCCIVAFLGGEYFFSKPFSFQLDFGPVYIWLRDNETEETEGGFDYVVNLGLNLYFGGK